MPISTVHTRRKEFWKRVGCTDEHLEKLYQFSVEKDLDPRIISSIASVKLMKDHPKYRWHRDYYSTSPHISIHEILISPDFPKGWSVTMISKRKDLTLPLVQKLMYQVRGLSYDYLSINPNVTYEFMKKKKSSRINGSWSRFRVAQNPNITPEIVMKRTPPDFPGAHWWSIWPMSNRPGLSLEFLRRNRHELHLNWEEVTINPSFTWDMIKSTCNVFEWDFEAVPGNPNVTWEMVMEEYIPWLKENGYYEIIQDSIQYGSSPYLTVEIVEKHPELFKDEYDMERNPHLSEDFIHSLWDKYYWDGFQLPFNMNISLEFALSHDLKPLEDGVNEWNWEGFITPAREELRLKKIEKEAREHVAAYRIQWWWREIRLHPRHPVGNKRLRREADRDVSSFNSRDSK